MIMPPGHDSDLDALTDGAIRSGDSNPRIERGWYGDDEDSLLVALCVHGRLDLTEMLLNAGATMSASDLAHIIWWNCGVATVTFLLEHGTPHNEECLRAAVRHGNWDVAFVLLDRNADIKACLNFKVNDTTSLLHVAALSGKSLVVQGLLDRGATVDERDTEEYTPLLKSCDLVSENIETDAASVYWLLKYGADPNAELASGETALVLCLGKPFSNLDPLHYFFKRRRNIAQILLRYGANPNVAAPTGATPLMFAARDDDTFLARTLLRAGAKKDACTSKGETAWDVARRWKSYEVLAMMRDSA